MAKQNQNTYKLVLIAIGFAVIVVALLPPGVHAQNDRTHGIIEEAPIRGGEESAEKYEESLKSYSPSPAPGSTSSGTDSNDSAKNQSDKSSKSTESSDASKESDESPNSVLYVAAGVIVLVAAAGTGLFVLKRRNK